MALLWTNFDPALTANGGAYHPGFAGSSNDAAMRDLLVSDFDANRAVSRWKRVTGAAPTPAFLQVHETAPIAGLFTSSRAQYATYYDSADPGLSAGTPYGRMFRLVVGGASTSTTYESYIILEAMDTRFSDTVWTSPSLNTSNAAEYHALDYASSSSSWTRERRHYWFEYDNAIVMMARSGDGGTLFGVGMVLLPDHPADGHAPRTDFGLPYISMGTNDYQGVPPGLGYPSGAQFDLTYEGGVLMRVSDVLGRDFLQRPFLRRTTSPPAIFPYDDDLRFTRPGAAAAMTTTVFGGRTYAVVEGASGRTLLCPIT